MADAVAAIAPSVVQVQGRRRPASGLVFSDHAVMTTVRALGADEGLRVCTPDRRTLDAEFSGWDPATGLAVLRINDLGVAPASRADAPARVGHLALAIARSWSNAVTASAGIIAIIGGPLRTGRHEHIDEIIRTTAPMHEGFAGGPLVAASGGVVGMCTATEIRGLGVVIPAAIAWKTAADILEHGSPKRGFLGVSGQSVRLADSQREAVGRQRALLVAGVTDGSPAAAAGVLVGDLIVALDNHAVESADDLLELLHADRTGRAIPLQIIRGGTRRDLTVTIGTRP